MLILFDVDGTLLLSDGAGVKAMTDAGRSLFGRSFSFDGVDFAGRLDPLIWAALAERNGIKNAEAEHDRFRAAYAEHLERRFAESSTARLLPGVEDLVNRLRQEDDITLGLLTGNYAETGAMKIRTAGLDPDRFPVQAWGDEGRHRRDLPAVAMARFAEQFGRPIDPDQVVVIGDTPHDIDCAHANGCLAIGVATGPSYSIDDLAAYEPELLVRDLSDADRVLGWLTERKALVAE